MRIAYHFQYRAARLGWDIEPNEVYSPERFGMSKGTQYALALQAEAETLLAASFRQICSLPAPPAFKALYERGQARWYQSRPARNRYESDIAT
jgi:hypothetical protein